MTDDRRGDVAVACGLVLVVCTVFWRWVIAPAHTLYTPWSDVVVQFSGWKAFMARAAADGHGIAFWNPTYFCGTPAYANPQYLWFHPLHALFHVLPVDQAVAPTFMLYLLLLGLGTHVWLRVCGLDVVSAGTGALAGMLAPRLLYHVAGGFLPYLLGVTLLPWAFAAVEWACRRSTLWRWSVAALALGLMVSSGFVQLWLYAGYALALYVLVRPADGWVPSPAATPVSPLAAPSRVPMPARRFLALAAAYAGSLVLAAYHFWPAYVFAQHTTRGGALPLERVTDVSVSGWHWLTVVLPQPWGDPSRMLVAGDGGWLLWEQSAAFGLVPILLLLAGRRGPHRRLWWGLTAVLLVCVAFAWGAGNPAFPLLYHLPGIARFRFPVRFLFVAGLAISGLTATGVAALRHPVARRAHPPAALGYLCAAGACVVLWLVVRTQAERLRMLPAAPVDLWWAVVAALGLALVTVAARRTPRAPWIVAAVLTFMVIDSSRAASWTVQAEDSALVYPLSEPVAHLRDAVAAAPHLRVMDFTGAIHKGLPGRTGIAIPDGYDPLQLAHMVRYMRVLTGDGHQGEGNSIGIPNVPSIRAPRLFALLGADTVLRRRTVQAVTSRDRAYFDVPTFQFWRGVGRIPDAVVMERSPVWRGGPVPDRATIARYNVVLPRAFVVGPARYVGEADEAAALAAFEPMHEVLLAAPPPVAGTASLAPAVITAYTPNRVTLTAESDGPGYLVLTDAWYPAWAATRNGAPAPILRADGMFRAVPLPAAGTWTVEMQYVPTAETRGAWVTLAGLLAFVVVGARARRRG